MGNPCFYYYPDEGGSLEVIDLGEGLSDIEETPGADVADSYAGDRTPFRAWYASTFRVRILLERFGTPGTSSVERALLSMQAHLARGGAVGFSRDHAKTWASIRSGAASRGDTSFPTAGNGFTGWSAAATLASGDEMVIEDLAGRREITTTTNATGGELTLSPGLIYTYEGHPLVRWRDFYPALTLPADQVGRALVTHDHRRNWTLEAIFEFSVAAAIGLWGDSYQSPYGGLGGLALRDTSGLGGLGLDELGGGRVATPRGVSARITIGRPRGAL